MQTTSNYGFKKPGANDTADITQMNPNWDTLDQKLHEVEQAASAPPGANTVSDDAIGERTPDQTQAPATPGTGKIGQLVSWITNRLKVITGKANWWDAPTKSLEEINSDVAAHKADNTKHISVNFKRKLRMGVRV